MKCSHLYVQLNHIATLYSVCMSLEPPVQQKVAEVLLVRALEDCY